MKLSLPSFAYVAAMGYFMMCSNDAYSVSAFTNTAITAITDKSSCTSSSNTIVCNAHSKSSDSSCTIKVCQNKHCKKNFPSKYDGGLPQVMEDIIPLSFHENLNLDIQTTGCFSHCQHGPNVEIDNSRVFNKVDGVEMAAAILDVGANIDAPEMGALMAAVEEMAKSNDRKLSFDKRIKYLTTAIGSLVSRGLDLGIDLSKTRVMAHALLLRADLRLEEVQSVHNVGSGIRSDIHGNSIGGTTFDEEIDLALEDAMHSLSIHDFDGRGWRLIADCKELQGDVLGAMDAIAKWGESNPSFILKAKKEMSRLSSITTGSTSTSTSTEDSSAMP